MSETNKPLGQLLLDLKEGRYSLVGLIKDWFSVLRRTDEGVGISEAELIKKAIEDVLSEKISEKDVKEAKNKMKKILTSDNDSKETKKKLSIGGALTATILSPISLSPMGIITGGSAAASGESILASQ